MFKHSKFFLFLFIFYLIVVIFNFILSQLKQTTCTTWKIMMLIKLNKQINKKKNQFLITIERKKNETVWWHQNKKLNHCHNIEWKAKRKKLILRKRNWHLAPFLSVLPSYLVWSGWLRFTVQLFFCSFCPNLILANRNTINYFSKFINERKVAKIVERTSSKVQFSSTKI